MGRGAVAFGGLRARFFRAWPQARWRSPARVPCQARRRRGGSGVRPGWPSARRRPRPGPQPQPPHEPLVVVPGHPGGGDLLHVAEGRDGAVAERRPVPDGLRFVQPYQGFRQGVIVGVPDCPDRRGGDQPAAAAIRRAAGGLPAQDPAQRPGRSPWTTPRSRRCGRTAAGSGPRPPASGPVTAPAGTCSPA